jgi:SAM-dependent methyltransferase
MPEGLFPDGTRVSGGPGLGPVPAWTTPTTLTALLDRLSTPAGPPERGRQMEVQTGLLVCGACGRWFPIEGGIPELLSDHLRDAKREAALFKTATQGAPADLCRALEAFTPSGDASTDPGAHYKKAEIGIKSKIDDPHFFGPGYSSPFNPWNSEFTVYLISLFGAVMPMLNAKRGDVIVDSGCGYSWSTEWLFRSGFDPIGVDICRTYLEIAIARIGAALRPHVVVGDVENLPLAASTASAILAYESFHHIPDRQRAMASYDRVLKDGGTVILAEPGGEHESAKVSVDAMEKYGILERGMELDDVVRYTADTSFGDVEQVYVLRVAQDELGPAIDHEFCKRHSAFEGNLFRLSKGPKRSHRYDVRSARPLTAARIVRGLKRRLSPF